MQDHLPVTVYTLVGTLVCGGGGGIILPVPQITCTIPPYPHNFPASSCPVTPGITGLLTTNLRLDFFHTNDVTMSKPHTGIHSLDDWDGLAARKSAATEEVVLAVVARSGHFPLVFVPT